MRKLLYIFILLFITSCTSNRLPKKYNKLESRQNELIAKMKAKGIEFTPVRETKVVTTLDTIIDERVIKEYEFIEVHDTLKVPCPEKLNVPKQSTKQQGVTLDIEIKDNNVIAKCKADSLLRELTIKERLVKEYSTIIEKDKMLISNSKDKGFKDGVYVSLIILAFVAILFFLGRQLKKSA